MTQSKAKSRTFRRVKKKTPGNRLTTQYTRKTPRKAHCGNCGAILQGIKPRTPIRLNKLSKTQKRPERAFGGVLCSKCSRETIKAKARK